MHGQEMITIISLLELLLVVCDMAAACSHYHRKDPGIIHG